MPALSPNGAEVSDLILAWSAPIQYAEPRPRSSTDEQGRYDRALYPRCHQRHPGGHEPTGSPYAAEAQGRRAARLTRDARVASGAGGRGYLPRPWTGMA